MNRKQFLKMSGLAGCGGVLVGCEGMDALAKMPEGSGVQMVSGVVFLAKYKATNGQRAEAKQRAARVVVKQGLNPAYKAKVQAIETKRVRDVDRASSPAEKEKITEAAEVQKKKVAASVSAQILKMSGREYHPDSVAPRSVAAIPPDPSMNREVKQLVQNYLNAPTLAVPVSIAGMEVERKTPSSVTVMTFSTSSLDLASGYAYVINTMPKSGEKISLDGSRAVYKG